MAKSRNLRKKSELIPGRKIKRIPKPTELEIIFNRIQELSKTRLPDIWCDLNSYTWPLLLMCVAPKGYANFERDRRLSFTIPTMDFIESIIGNEVCVKAWRRKHGIKEPSPGVI